MSTTRETPSLLFDVMTGEVITGRSKIDSMTLSGDVIYSDY